jgi:hypothetical protein
VGECDPDDFVTGMVEASQELVHGIGVSIVAIDFLPVRFPRGFVEHNLVLLVVLGVLNEDVVGVHEILHPFDRDVGIVATFRSTHVLDGTSLQVMPAIHTVVSERSNGHVMERIGAQLLTLEIFEVDEELTETLESTSKYIHIRMTVILKLHLKIKLHFLRNLLFVPQNKITLDFRFHLTISIPLLGRDRTLVIVKSRNIEMMWKVSFTEFFQPKHLRNRSE